MKNHCEKFKQTIPFGRWVHHEDLHITLAFLGFAPLEKIEKAEINVRNALNHTKSFTLTINDLGFFGKEESPRIFWADTKENDELQLVRKWVYTACVEAGFQLESRPFRPHITLARKWVGVEPFQTEVLGLWKQLQPEPLLFDAMDVVLYQTHPQKTPKYEVKTVFPLV